MMPIATGNAGSGLAPCWWCKGRGHVFGVATSYAYRCEECQGTGQIVYVALPDKRAQYLLNE